MKPSRTGQMWVTDLTLSILLFSVALIAALGIIINSFNSNEAFDSTKEDASRISEYILADGIPASWNESSAVRPGIVSYHRINSTKINAAMSLSNNSYSRLKTMMQTKNDFLIIFENKSGSTVSFGNYCVIGSPTAAITKTFNATLGKVTCSSPDFSSVSYKNLARITRLSIYNSSIVKMQIYVWN